MSDKASKFNPMTESLHESLSYGTPLPLPPSTLLPTSHPTVTRTLTRLTRSALLSLALDWLSDVNQPLTAPYLLPQYDIETNDIFPPASSLDQLRVLYNGLERRLGTKKDVLDRILEGDWRFGISLYALAMADMQFLNTHPSSQKWQAWEITLSSSSSPVQQSFESRVPRFHPPTFLRNMQLEFLPDIKVHFNIDRHDKLPLLILRVLVLESPYSTSFSLMHNVVRFSNCSRVFYIAFPDYSPYVFISSTNTLSVDPLLSKKKVGSSRYLRELVLEAIPKAYSKPGERYSIQRTMLSARSLEALVEHRGNGRTNAASGVWSSYAETNGSEAKRDNPLNSSLTTSYFQECDGFITNETSGTTRKVAKLTTSNIKRKSESNDFKMSLAQKRFGGSAIPTDGKGINRLFVKIVDPFPRTSINTVQFNYHQTTRLPEKPHERNSIGKRSLTQLKNQRNQIKGSEQAQIESWRPEISISFSGSHVIAGIRELVECGIIDGALMPGWMTGEQGISEGIIRNGRIYNLEMN